LLHAGTKTALGIIQLWFNYFVASFFKALVMYFSWKAKERKASVVVVLLSVALFVWG